MTEIRIIARLNGDYKTDGKQLTLNSSSTLEQLFEIASNQLGVAEDGKEEVKLSFDRAYNAAGAEVTDVSKLKDGDAIYFAVSGETFISASDAKAFSAHTRIASDTAAKVQSLYETYSLFLKSKAPAFVGNTLTKVENSVNQVLSNPSVKNITGSVLNWADEKLDKAHAQYQAISSSFLNSEFAKNLNASISSTVATLKEKEEVFFRVSAEQWQLLKDKNADMKNSVDEFIVGLKVKLGTSWNDNLVEPAKNFYAAATHEYEELTKKQEGKTNIQSIYSNIKTKLGTAWETKVAANFHAKVLTPAENFYRQALASFVEKDKDGKGQVSLAEYLESLKVKIGTAWNENLVAPAKHLYEKFHASYSSSSSSSASSSASASASASTQ